MDTLLTPHLAHSSHRVGVVKGFGLMASKVQISILLGWGFKANIVNKTL